MQSSNLSRRRKKARKIIKDIKRRKKIMDWSAMLLAMIIAILVLAVNYLLEGKIIKKK